MEYISSKNICLLIRDTLKLIDRRPMDHGSRTGYIMCKMLQQKGGYEGFELADFLMVATVHDIGAYKTDNVGDKLRYEFKNMLPHSIYGFLFLKILSPLADKSRMVLYHRLGAAALTNIDFEYKFETEVLCLAEAVDTYHFSMGQKFNHDIFRRQEGSIYSTRALELLDETVANNPQMFEKLRDESYQQELDEILQFMIFPNEEKKRYMEMLMYCLGFRSESRVVDAVTTLSITEILGEKMGLSEGEREVLYYGSLLHDIGMLSIPGELIDAPRPLTPEEIALIRTHVEREEKIFSNRLDEEVTKVAIAHHERMDGKGYPKGLKEEDMNIPQCILQLADVVTALNNKRSYHEGHDKEMLMNALQKEIDSNKLKKEVVEAFINSHDEIMDKVSNESAKTLSMYEDLRKKYDAVKASLER